MAVILMTFVACNKGPGYSSPWKGSQGFAKENMTVVVHKNTTYFEFGYMNTEVEDVDRIFTLSVCKELSTAEEGVHYILPESMEFVLPAGKITELPIRVELIPENIKSELTLVFAGPFDLALDARPWIWENGIIYGSMIKLVPVPED